MIEEHPETVELRRLSDTIETYIYLVAPSILRSTFSAFLKHLMIVGERHGISEGLSAVFEWVTRINGRPRCLLSKESTCEGNCPISHQCNISSLQGHFFLACVACPDDILTGVSPARMNFIIKRYR